MVLRSRWQIGDGDSHQKTNGFLEELLQISFFISGIFVNDFENRSHTSESWAGQYWVQIFLKTGLAFFHVKEECAISVHGFGVARKQLPLPGHFCLEWGRKLPQRRCSRKYFCRFFSVVAFVHFEGCVQYTTWLYHWWVPKDFEKLSTLRKCLKTTFRSAWFSSTSGINRFLINENRFGNWFSKYSKNP